MGNENQNFSRGRGRRGGSTSSDAVYGMGFIGALVYFIQTATSFWIGVLGVLKAIFWPAFIVYKALEYLKL